MSQDGKDIDVDGGSSAKGLMVLGLLIGLGIGGGAAYFFLQDRLAPADPNAPAEEERVENREPLQAVRFERLTVPIYSVSGSRRRFIGNFFINIDVLVRGDSNLIAVRRSEPQLQHAFIAAISQNDLMREDSPQQLDLEKTAQLLKSRANSVLGSDVVAEVSVIEALRIAN